MKKHIAGWLLVIAVVFAVSPMAAKADTVSDLQAQVAQLVQMVAKLQAQLSAQGGGQSNTASSATAWCYTFNKGLRIGDSGYDIEQLALALNKEGLINGKTDSFDEEVASAVTAFQEKYKSEILTPNGLSNGTGFVGASTRAKLNKLYGCNNGNNNQSTGNTTTGNGSATIPAGKYICGYTNSIPGNPIYCDLTSSTQSIIPSVSSVTPQPVQVGSPLTVYFSNGGSTGSVILKTVDGTKSWHIPYTTGKVYNGFTYYDGSKITFTVPSMIGRGQLPENTGYETPVPITSGIYNLFVYQTGMSTTGNAFQITINVPSTISGPTISYIQSPAENKNIIHAGERAFIYGSGLASATAVYVNSQIVSMDRTKTTDSNLMFYAPASLTEMGTATVYVQTVDGKNSNSISVQTVAPTSTTQPASSNAQVSASLVSANFDYAGTWGVFSYDGNPDWAWKMSLSVNAQKTIKSISILGNTADEGWSTSVNTGLLSKQLYPLVIGNHDSGQINKGYSDNLSISQSAGNTTEYSLYGQIVSKQWPGGKIIVIFTDGTQTTVAIPSSSLTPPSSTPATQPSCNLTSDKTSYNLGDTITLYWTSQNATSASWQQDTSGKDHLNLPGDKLAASGSQTISANVIGSPSVTLLVNSSSGSSSCNKTINVTSVNQPTITVLSPNGGENYQQGQQIPVRWTYANLPGVSSGSTERVENISIKVVPQNGTTCEVVSSIPVVGGSYPINSSVGQGCYPLSAGIYRIFLKVGLSANAGTAEDYSDSYFTVTAPVTVAAPAIKINNSFSPATVQSGTLSANFANLQLDTTASGEDVRIESMYPTYRVASGTYSDVTNCHIVDTGNTITSSTLTPSMYGAALFTFNPPFVVPKGTVKTMNMLCDVSANAASGSSYKWAIGSGSTVVGYGVISGTKATVTSISSGDSVSTQPTSTSESLQFSLISQTEDHAGMWNTFSSNDAYDWKISATIALNSARTISSIDFYSVGNNEQWSTSLSSMYPLVVFKDGSQINKAYGQTIPLNAGTNQLMLYAQMEHVTLNSPKLIVKFTDGTSLTASTMTSQTNSISNMAAALESYRLILEGMKKSL